MRKKHDRHQNLVTFAVYLSKWTLWVVFEKYMQDYTEFPFALGCRGLIPPRGSRCPRRPPIPGSPIILCCAWGQINDCRFFPTNSEREVHGDPDSHRSQGSEELSSLIRPVTRIAECCSPTACRDSVCPAKASLQLCWEHPSSSPNPLWKAASAVRLEDTLLSLPPLPFSKIRKKELGKQGWRFQRAGETLQCC